MDDRACRRRIHTLLAGFAVWGLLSSALAQQVYKHVDAQGRITYTNAPVDPGFELKSGATPKPEQKSRADDARTLSVAAQSGDLETVRKLLASGVSPNATRATAEQPPLHQAVNAMNNATATVKALLDAGADPNAHRNDGSTPLHIVRDPAVAAILINAGAGIEARDQFDRTPLQTAVSNNQPAMVEFLLERGANLEARAKSGDTALLDAALKHRLDILRSLLAKGARLDAQNTAGTTALHYAARGQSAELVEILLEAGAPVNAYDKSRRTPLDSANPAYPEIAEALVRRGGFRAGGPKSSITSSHSLGSYRADSGNVSSSPPRSPSSSGGMDKSVSSYSYDAQGHLSRVERQGSVTTYEYDERNNLVRRNRDGAVREYQVNGENQIIRMQDR